MSDAVIISLVTNFAVIIVAGIGAFWSYKAKVGARETHLAVNSRMDELLKMAESKYHALGVLDEKGEERKRVEEKELNQG